MSATAARAAQPSVCFATADFAGIVRNGGIGTHFWLMSELLVERGWDVVVLFCGDCDDEERLRAAPADLRRAGIEFRALGDFPAPPGAGTPHFGGGAPQLELSEHALAALEELHAEHRFDLIEFPDWRALGLRPVQAKAAGDALVDTRLAVKLHSTTQWQRVGNLAEVPGPQELTADFCERFAFERADVQLSPSRYMLDYARGLDWQVRADAAVAYPYPRVLGAGASAGAIEELVFFGRLERRKGLHLFLEALDTVDPELPVRFLGKDTLIDGRLASEHIEERLGARPFAIETELDRDAALARLCEGGRMAVIPSLSETFGFTVAECVAHRIPFVAAASGGIPEVVDHPSGRESWLFEPTAAGLAGAVNARLATSPELDFELRSEVAAACDPNRWNDRVETVYRGLADRPVRATVPASPPATITVAIAHYNHEDFLPEALASLAAQTRPPDEVVVVDDGSTSEAARRVFDEQERLYPDWRFERGVNVGPGAVRNRCLANCESTYFLPFDSDNVATPRMLERLLESMRRNPGLAATTCHNLAFTDPAEIEAGDFLFRYAPTGGPRITACLDNVYGDTCALFDAEALRNVGGFEDQNWSPHEDWETFVKMASAGLELAVLPQPLFYYRTRVGGRLETLTGDPAMVFRHRRHMIDLFLADANLTPRERRDLWECVLGFGYASYGGVQQQLVEQQLWHESEMKSLRDWSDARVEGLRSHLLEAHATELENLRTWADGEREALHQHMLEQIEHHQRHAEAAERALERRPVAFPGSRHLRRAGNLLRRIARRCRELNRRALAKARRLAGRAKRGGLRRARGLKARIRATLGRIRRWVRGAFRRPRDPGSRERT